MLDPNWIVYTTPKPPTSCVILLPGRTQHCIDLLWKWKETDLYETLIVGITPTLRCWYPMPNSPMDQEEAVSGLERARLVIESVITKISKQYGIPRNKIALAGFSAGGVMSLYTGTHGEELAGVVSHGGAILEPFNVPMCKAPEMPVIMTHGTRDSNFDWEERFVPMWKSLRKRHYKTYTCIKVKGEHIVSFEDVLYSAVALSERLGYSDHWRRKRYEMWSFSKEDFAYAGTGKHHTYY